LLCGKGHFKIGQRAFKFQSSLCRMHYVKWVIFCLLVNFSTSEFPIWQHIMQITNLVLLLWTQISIISCAIPVRLIILSSLIRNSCTTNELCICLFGTWMLAACDLWYVWPKLVNSFIMSDTLLLSVYNSVYEKNTSMRWPTCIEI
jgi:hypothetical protein